jgi:1-acyl-sn-glycerol-3-phosphate acyltransferase
VELEPKHRELRIELDSQLERDLGMTSLARAELLRRVSRELGVQLPAEVLAEAQTVRDLIGAVNLVFGERGGEEPPPLALGPAAQAPAAATTLIDVLDWHTEHHPDRVHVLLPGSAITVTYASLHAEAQSIAEGLRARDIAPGDRVGLMLPTGSDFFRTFFGILYAGAVAVPIYPPFRRATLEDHLLRQSRILANAGAALLVAQPEAHALARLLRIPVETPRALLAGDVAPLPSRKTPSDLALLQYTSGSTGDPKGVMLAHGNILANIRSAGRAAGVSSNDVLVSWLPLYHDMGLIGSWLAGLYFAMPAVILSPVEFLARPSRWLWTMHRHRATLSPSPNFGFDLCLKSFDRDEYEGIDLSSVRLLFNGAEPVSPSTLRRFTETFAPYGLKPEALAPVYGLAESSVALALPPLGRRPVIDRVRREALVEHGRAAPASPEDARAIEAVACGRPIPGHQIRVVDDAGREVGDRVEGRIQFQGPSATRGYFENPEATRALFDGPWLETGDRGYFAGGDLFITGRIKDIVIRAGRNIYPQEVEEAVGELEGVRKGCVAVFGSKDPGSGTERLVIVAETRVTDRLERETIERRIRELAVDLLDAAPDDIVLAPPHSVLKTSSGKIRRAASRAAYESGALGSGPRPYAWQLSRLAFRAVLPQLESWRRTVAGLLFAAYWWSALALCAGIGWPLVVALPRLEWRWAILRGIARWFLWITGARLTVDHREGSIEGPCIYVSNHASQIDSLVMAVITPGQPIFAAKRELAARFSTRWFVRRIGAVFVERLDVAKGVEDAQVNLLEAARSGRSLIVYAEGGTSRRPGVSSFRLGAFVTAAMADLPIVPVTIRGTRSLLRGRQWVPRRARVEAVIDRPLRPAGRSFAAAVELREQARRIILERSGEPDLAGDEQPLARKRRRS